MQHPFKQFIAFDLETTGLDPDKDTIIEIGAVKFEDSRPVDTFSTKVRLNGELNYFIEQLTGIHSTDLTKAPSCEEALLQFRSFIGHLPLVAHNSDVDEKFINIAISNHNLPTLTNPIYDNLLFSRICWPSAPNHRLGTLIKYLNIDIKGSHRASIDAEACGKIFIMAMAGIESFSPQTLGECHYLTKGTTLNIHGFFDYACRYINNDVQNILPETDSVPIPQIVSTSTRKVSCSDSNPPNSAFHQIFKKASYSYVEISSEKSSRELLEAACSYIIEEGKNIAWLINSHSLGSSVYHNWLNHYKGKFPGIICQCWGAHDRFLDKKNWQMVLDHKADLLSIEETKESLLLCSWLAQKGHRDIGACKGFSRYKNETLWEKLKKTRRNASIGADFSTAISSRQDGSGQLLAIVDEEYFIEDLHLDLAQLSQFDFLIIEDTDNFLNSISKIQKTSLSFFGFKRILQNLFNPRQGSTGILPALKASEFLSSDAGILIDKCIDSINISDKYFHRFLLKIGAFCKKKRESLSHKIRLTQPVALTFNSDPLKFKNSLIELTGFLEALINSFDGSGSEQAFSTWAHHHLVNALEKINSFSFSFDEIINVTNPEKAYWIESPGNPHKIILSSQTINLSVFLQQKFLPLNIPVLFGSPHAAIQQTFISKSLGLKPKDLFILPPAPHTQFTSRILLPKWKSDNEASKDIEQLVFTNLSQLNTISIVFFSSNSHLIRAYTKAVPIFKKAGRHLLAHGPDGSKENLKALLPRFPHACILATYSIGDLRSFVPIDLAVILRLPFPSSKDPYSEACIEYLQEKGKNAFKDHILPEAINTMARVKSAFGDKETGKSALWLMDERISQKTYGNSLLKSLGGSIIHSQTPADMLDATRKFLDLN